MSNLDKTPLSKEQLEHLPLAFRRLYSNKITYIESELKLFKYNPKIQDIAMRRAYPPKTISKIFIPKTVSNEENK